MDVLETLDNLQTAATDDEKKMNNKQKYNFDKLKMYFGEDYKIANINISIPTIGDILDIGEDKFYTALKPFLNNPTSVRVFLYDVLHKDWNKTSDIEVFYILMHVSSDKEPLKLMFKDTDFSDFELRSISDGDKEHLVLVSNSQNLIITEDNLTELLEYVRSIMNVHPKVEKAKGKTTKLWILQEDRTKALNKKNEEDSTLLPLISSCINHPGFKYKLEELKKVNICQFMDSVKRIQKYEQGTAAIKGMYSGMISGKDLPEDLINFMGDV